MAEQLSNYTVLSCLPIRDIRILQQLDNLAPLLEVAKGLLKYPIEHPIIHRIRYLVETWKRPHQAPDRRLFQNMLGVPDFLRATVHIGHPPALRERKTKVDFGGSLARAETHKRIAHCRSCLYSARQRNEFACYCHHIELREMPRPELNPIVWKMEQDALVKIRESASVGHSCAAMSS